MKIGWVFPSNNYNIVLSRDELKQLIEKGHISVLSSRVPCSTGRGIYNPATNEMETHDKKEMYNDLLFRTDEPVAEIEAGIYPVQFLCITVQD